MPHVVTGKGWQSAEYNVWDYDQRPWGFWLVTDTRDTKDSAYCEKIIIVAPGKILSLQSHKLRHETWTVLDGTLTAVIDGSYLMLKTGQKIEVPADCPHCMANLNDTPCVVKERQTGICLESDIVRYMDAYGRLTTDTNDRIKSSADLYLAILEQMQGKQQKYA